MSTVWSIFTTLNVYKQKSFWFVSRVFQFFNFSNDILYFFESHNYYIVNTLLKRCSCVSYKLLMPKSNIEK